MHRPFPGRARWGLFLLLAAACAAPPASDAPPVLPENPLPPCPSAPNCARASRAYDATPEAVFAHARATLQAADARDVEAVEPERRLRAVFKVLFFKDDFDLAVVPHEDGAVLHVRSASRAGRYDFGVNGRRVRRFFEALEARL